MIFPSLLSIIIHMLYVHSANTTNCTNENAKIGANYWNREFSNKNVEAKMIADILNEMRAEVARGDNISYPVKAENMMEVSYDDSLADEAEETRLPSYDIDNKEESRHQLLRWYTCDSSETLDEKFIRETMRDWFNEALFFLKVEIPSNLAFNEYGFYVSVLAANTRGIGCVFGVYSCEEDSAIMSGSACKRYAELRCVFDYTLVKDILPYTVRSYGGMCTGGLEESKKFIGLCHEASTEDIPNKLNHRRPFGVLGRFLGGS